MKEEKKAGANVVLKETQLWYFSEPDLVFFLWHMAKAWTEVIFFPFVCSPNILIFRAQSDDELHAQRVLSEVFRRVNLVQIDSKY